MMRFSVGDVVHHLKFDYRGVVVRADLEFMGSDPWYDHVARSRPPKDKPWYHVLVDGAHHNTYVAERHLELDGSGKPVVHPQVEIFFDRFHKGVYSNTRMMN